MIRLLTKVALICAGIVGLILGSHGLYVYFKLSSFRGMLISVGAMASSNLSPEEYLSQLFLFWGVPNPFKDWVLWASVRGFESWFVPVVLVVAGIVLLSVQSSWLPGFRVQLPGKGPWKSSASLKQKAVKALLCLLLIGAVTFLVWSAYYVFLRKENPIWGLNAFAGAIVILATMGLVALSAKWLESRRYKWTPPSFVSVLAVLAVVVLVFALAGVQPLSGWKDSAVSGVKGDSGGNSGGKATKEVTVVVDGEGIYKSPYYSGILVPVIVTPKAIPTTFLLYSVRLTSQEGYYFDEETYSWKEGEAPTSKEHVFSITADDTDASHVYSQLLSDLQRNDRAALAKHASELLKVEVAKL